MADRCRSLIVVRLGFFFPPPPGRRSPHCTVGEHASAEKRVVRTIRHAHNTTLYSRVYVQPVPIFDFNDAGHATG